MEDRLILAGILVVACAVLIGLIERWRSGGPSALPRLDCDPSPLSSAAEIAYAYARERRLPLASVADRKGGSQWFETSILKNVPVSATCLRSGRRTRLAAGSYVHALPDGLSRSASGKADYTDPMIGRRAFRAYLRWMTSVW
ncbi:MAG: hypothetical protein KGJ78_11480 [Alphaproteobacteria bacterium]|nr:hypothetical protein [Alphaproteobacteria bacterium]